MNIHLALPLNWGQDVKISMLLSSGDTTNYHYDRQISVPISPEILICDSSLTSPPSLSPYLSLLPPPFPRNHKNWILLSDEVLS